MFYIAKKKKRRHAYVLNKQNKRNSVIIQLRKSSGHSGSDKSLFLFLTHNAQQ